MSKNSNLHAAKAARKDEYYTQLADIERELRHYKQHFRGKVVYCNCDDPRVSNFFHYFSYNFEALGLKRLITTCYKNQSPDLFSRHDSERAIWLEYNGDKDGNRVPDPEEIGTFPLRENGDFRSAECIDLLKQADIVVTNPPFSLFREYMSQLMEYKKNFVIIGPRNALTYKEIFPLIRDNKVWLGYGFKSGNAYFKTNQSKDDFAPGVYNENTDLVLFRNVVWYTNLDHTKRSEETILYETYSPQKYSKYDNYDAIEVRKTKEIPKDYAGVMGVPITFLDKYNPDQFQIIGATESEGKGFSAGLWLPEVGTAQALIKGKRVFKRLFIQNRNL